MMYLLGLFLSLVLGSLSAEIIETAHFKELSQHITDKSLVILDIDDTLLIPVQTLGRDVWFQDRFCKYRQEMGDFAKALDKALAEWEAVRHLTQIKIVEEGTEAFIQELQNNQITIMGLTTQGLALATRTVNQLHSLDIDLIKTAPRKEDLYFFNKQGILFRKGILFTSGTSKGEALFLFLDQIGYLPEKIIFINDKLTHLCDIEEKAIERNVSFIGLRYSYSDQWVNSYRPEIASIQWKHSSFERILSDEEASSYLQD